MVLSAYQARLTEAPDDEKMMNCGTLNVAMVVRSFSRSGGLELYAHQVIDGLLQRGHRVTVFCQSKDSDLEHENLTVKNIQLRPAGVRKQDRLNHDLRAGDEALANEHAKFDIVHSQHYPTSYATVATFHNHTVWRWSEVGLNWERWVNDFKFASVRAYKIRDEQDRLLCQNAKCVVFPAKVMQEDYYAHYKFLNDGTPHVVAYPGSGLGTKTLSAKPSVPQKPFTFLFVGRGYRRKGLDIVLDACALLRKEGADFRLLIAGLKEKPIDKMRLVARGLTEKVQYLGFRKDMENVYAMATAAVLPSRVEPFGMAPVQAAEFGLVPIVSRVSGVSEVLKHNEDCLILENHLDAHQLALLMRQLMTDQPLVQRLANNAQKTAERINWDVTVENTLRAYELAMGTDSREKQTQQTASAVK